MMAPAPFMRPRIAAIERMDSLRRSVWTGDGIGSGYADDGEGPGITDLRKKTSTTQNVIQCSMLDGFLTARRVDRRYVRRDED